SHFSLTLFISPSIFENFCFLFFLFALFNKFSHIFSLILSLSHLPTLPPSLSFSSSFFLFQAFYRIQKELNSTRRLSRLLSLSRLSFLPQFYFFSPSLLSFSLSLPLSLSL